MGGVFISEGMGFRIPAGGLTISLSEEAAVTSSMTVQLTLDVWPMWLDVALDHAEIALQVRSDLRAAIGQLSGERLDGQTQNELMTSECKASMVAITAAAFALDSFYSVVQRFAPSIAEAEKQWDQASTARYRRVSETLRRTFVTSNAKAQERGHSITQIFRFRDWAVHPPADWRQPVKHDLIGSGVEWRFVAFRASNAVTAARVATSIIGECIDAPRSTSQSLLSWCEGWRPRIKPRWDRAKNDLVEVP